MIRYIKRQQHKKILTPRYKTIRTTTEVWPWNDQYKITGGLKPVLPYLTSPHPQLLQWFTAFSWLFGPHGEYLPSQ